MLEYRVRFTQTKPDVPGEFWGAENFLTGAVVLDQTLQISFPASKYVKVVSQSVQPQIREENGRKVYFWKTSQLKPTSAKQDQTTKPKLPDVQFTTFKTWADVGRWYGQLVAERAIVTPTIQAKAAEPTKGLTSTDQKEKAIYRYVSTQFRYISLSFGIGRYQPHFAEDVLSNKYGDCKDKHTLFAALLKAAGIEAWPVLIGDGVKLDPDVPSPAPFNHVITVLPDAKGLTWLDTTPEVAPFGLLVSPLRDKQALVIPDNGPAYLAKTPADPPFSSSQVVTAIASLFADGTLSAHFDFTLRGDVELIYRTIFRQLPPSNWQTVMQKIMGVAGFQGGTVSGVSVGNPEDLDVPLHYAFDFVDKGYSDQANHRFTLPVLPYYFSDGDKKPSGPISLGPPGRAVYSATVKLPKGFSVKLLAAVSLHTDFASYHSSYAMADGVLTATRELVITKSKIPVNAWEQYHNFAQKIRDDQGQWVQFSAPAKPAPPPSTDAQAKKLLDQAMADLRNGNTNAARDALTEVQRLNPKQPWLWLSWASFYGRTGELQKAEDSMQKAIALHPDWAPPYRALASYYLYYKQQDQAVETLRTGLKKVPGNAAMISDLSRLLMASKRYQDALDLLRTPAAKDLKNQQLEMELTAALLRTGRKEEGLAAAQRVAADFPNALALNNTAYALADTNTDLPLALQYAQKAVMLQESTMKQVTLASLTNTDLSDVISLAASWDTLGWAYFKSGDNESAKKYLQAAWLLSQRGDVADHLAQVYAKEGKQTKAIHIWKLALAADRNLSDVRDRLSKLGVHTDLPAPVDLLRQAAAHKMPRPSGGSPEETELSQLRTTKIPGIPKQEASAEFFLLLSASKVEDAQFIRGSDQLKSATSALLKAHYRMPFPDNGPEKIARRGILSCSTYSTPSCEFVFLLPSTMRR